MNNDEIIMEIAKSVYGENSVRYFLDNDIPIPLHTEQHWRTLAYEVKEDEKKHGIEAQIWKKRKTGENDFYKTKCYLYRDDQVVKM